MSKKLSQPARHPELTELAVEALLGGGSVTFGNCELATCPRVKAGDLIDCPTCGKRHRLKGGEYEGSNIGAGPLLFYDCGKESYLAAVDGRNVMELRGRGE